MNNSDLLYLKDDAYFEPLFNHWYAWPYLIPPVTAARYTVNTHKRIMTSFINNYELHMIAVKEKGMAGAEFLDCNEDQLPQIRELLSKLETNCKELVNLSAAVDELEELLRGHVSGKSIEPLYSMVPVPLKGFVELFLDSEHRASYRLIEPLIYRSELFKLSLQSVCFGVLSKVEERPFVLSTPRLPDENHLQMNINFNDPRLDSILSAREFPLTREAVRSIGDEIAVDGGLELEELFTDNKSEYRHLPVERDIRLSYTGHAGFLIETSELAILIDPVITSRGESYADEVISYTELPQRIDYICLTHNHQDHVNLETLLQLRYKTENVLVAKNNGGTILDPSIRQLLKQFGFNVLEVDDLDEIGVPGGRIVAIPFLGEHGDLNIRSKTAFYVELYGRKFFFGADSSNPDKSLYDKLGQLFHDVDILAIGMECIGAPYTWLYGALHTKMVTKEIKESRRLNGSDSSQAFPMVEAFGAKRVLIYALGMEPWYKYFMGIEYDDDSTQIVESKKMIDLCRGVNISAETLYGKKVIDFDRVSQ